MLEAYPVQLERMVGQVVAVALVNTATPTERPVEQLPHQAKETPEGPEEKDLIPQAAAGVEAEQEPQELPVEMRPQAFVEHPATAATGPQVPIQVHR